MQEMFFFIVLAVTAICIGIWFMVKNDFEEDPCENCNEQVYNAGCRGCAYEGHDGSFTGGAA